MLSDPRRARDASGSLTRPRHRLSNDVQGTPEAPPEGDEELDLVGFLADDPELADEIQKIATLERAGDDMREWHDAPSSPRQ